MDEITSPVDITCPHCYKGVTITPDVSVANEIAKMPDVIESIDSAQGVPENKEPPSNEESTNKVIEKTVEESSAEMDDKENQVNEERFLGVPYEEGSTKEITDKNRKGRFYNAIIYFRKCLSEVFTLKNTLLFLILIIIIPVMFSGVDNSSDNAISTYPVGYQIASSANMYLLLAFIWIAGLPLAFMAGSMASGLVSSEVREGTMLLLVSKPLTRNEIIGYKYLSVILYCFVMEAIGIPLSMFAYVNNLGVNSQVMGSMFHFYPYILAYSVIVSVVFSSIGLILSVTLSSPQKSSITVILIVVLTYLGFFLLRMFIGPMYQEFYIYTGDIGYQLGSTYIYMLSLSGARLTPDFQMNFNLFTGVYNTDAVSTLTDLDQGFQLPGLPYKNLIAPYLCTVIWIAIPFAILVLTFMIWSKKEVYF